MGRVTTPPVPSAATFTEHLRAATEFLEAIAADRDLLDTVSREERERLLRAVSIVRGPASRSRRRLVKALAREERAAHAARIQSLRADTGIQVLRRKSNFTTPNVFPPVNFQPEDAAEDPQAPAPDYAGRQHCYICKVKYSTVHHFYDQLCPGCAEVNFAKRTELADLRGRVALLTGGRVKIGYQASLKLLRSGAHVVVTTRFPRDAATRYAREHDCDRWGNQLEIVGLDLRHTPSVEAFCREFQATHDRLDLIINNACQTVRRPPEFYAHMMRQETAGLEGKALDLRVADRLGLTHSAELSQVALLPEDFLERKDLFPAGQLDQDLQQVDLRGRNSWRLLLDEVSSVELLEVQLVNAVAPFVINARLKPLMLRTPNRDKHIVNVSAVEGQFYRRFKTTRHPHTNMAKAALNMMTRTSAPDFVKDGIHMNAVDTGWVTDEDPAVHAARKAEEGFAPPLDIIDGAARIVDPIFVGRLTGAHVWGPFLKDYKPAPW